MAFAELNGARIAYDDTGGDGPPVILAHGFLMDRSMFAPQVAALAPAYRVITWDERGHGDTTSTGDFTYWDSADDCLALLDHLGIDRAVVGGMSQGGFVSLRVALRAPERVRALLLFDTQAGQEDPEVVPLYQGMLDQWISEGPSDELAGIVASLIIGDPELSAPWIARWQARPAAGMREPGRTLLSRDDITDRLGEIACPALIVHGTADASIPMTKADELQAGLSGARPVVHIQDGSHAANLTHPEPVNAAVLAFLHEVAPPA
jgi:pimeloyl-ACP methyl ester carboxylesterase